MFDIIILKGKIVDGSGRKSYPADIGIKNGRIADISPTLEAEARETIDAAGCVVSPGFIDMHSHSDFTLLLHPQAESKIRQGVTTELTGNCGGSPAPVPIEGEVPSPFNLPAGCVFESRCPNARQVCRDTPPTLTRIAEGEYVACHFPLNNNT